MKNYHCFQSRCWRQRLGLVWCRVWNQYIHNRCLVVDANTKIDYPYTHLERTAMFSQFFFCHQAMETNLNFHLIQAHCRLHLWFESMWRFYPQLSVSMHLRTLRYREKYNVRRTGNFIHFINWEPIYLLNTNRLNILYTFF